MEWALANIINFASGVLFLLLGLWALRQRPPPSGRAVAWFAIIFGASWIVRNLPVDDSANPWVWLSWNLGFGVLWLASGIALVVVSLRFHADIPLSRRAWWLSSVPVAAYVLGDLMRAAATLHVEQSGLVGPGMFNSEWHADAVLFVMRTTIAAYTGAFWFFLTVIAARAMKADAEQAASLSTAAAALGVFPMFSSGAGIVTRLGSNATGFGTWHISLAAAFAVAVVWVVVAVRAIEPARPAARRVSLWLLGLILAGLITAAWLLPLLYGTKAPPPTPLNGIGRTVSVVLLVFAVLRHQMLATDVKLRFAVKGTTLAAVFIAVIFMVSEGAQIVFGERQQWLGLAAGGALVFALAPLQRFAERVSEKAVPTQVVDLHDEARSTFREAVRFTLRDGVMSPAEEEHLARLADQLGLSSAESLALRRDAVGHQSS